MASTALYTGQPHLPYSPIQMEGELDAQTDLESLADVLESTLAGIRIAAKAGKTRPALKRIAEVASVVFAGVDISAR
jgi:hypothetical protein